MIFTEDELSMIRKEFSALPYTLSQINFAIAVIAANHKQDYRAIGDTEHSVTFLCRTGYHWSTIAEIRWCISENENLSYAITCSLTPGSLVTKHLLQEYAEKHTAYLSELIKKYVQQSIVLQYTNVVKKKWGIR